MGYEKDRLKRIDSKTIAMPTRGNPRDDTLKSVVNNVKEWVVIASREYLQQEKRKAIAEQKRKEAERAAQIQKIETEDEMNLKLNSILKDIL
jgi:hypothetical protein